MIKEGGKCPSQDDIVRSGDLCIEGGGWVVAPRGPDVAARVLR